MQENVNTHDKVLSLLLSIVSCSFVRITQFQKSGSTRHQFGQVNDELLKTNAASETRPEFVNVNSIEYDNFRFNFSLISKHHAHIDCFLSQAEHNKKDMGAYEFSDKPKSIVDKRQNQHLLSANPLRFEVTFINEQTLPECLTDLCNEAFEENIDDNSSKQISVLSERARLINTLLKGLVVTLSSIDMIDHYRKLTKDSLTNLKSRSALQRGIDERIAHSGIALCMIHCIDFQHVNRKFGQAKGDSVLREIAKTIQKYSRSDDLSGRFGGALFGIAIQAKTVNEGHQLASKLQKALHQQTFLQNALRLGFNVGVAFVSQEEDQLDNTSTSSLLINRAEQALKAAQNANKPSIVQWEPDKFRLDEQEFNYLGGIFTPDNVTNYRNMLLLWDISSIIADEHTFVRLIKKVIERLAFTFEFTYAGIVSLPGKPEAANYGFELTNTTDIKECDWQDYEYSELLQNTAELAISNSQHTEHTEDTLNALVIPLGTDTQECFFIMGDNDLLDLTHDTVMLFVGFARQLGKALNRSQLEDQLNKNLEQQNAKLAQELLELKAGLKSSALVYRSSKMQKIVEQTQRAAQTDATILVTGESGTGKEKLINAIHTLSERSSQALIIVDCGSIPEALIESELFGHTKGAFTGAQSDSKGKIQAANGGILVLDEIGELPLAMQPKLLRFVQEKQYTPVGSNKSHKVDVKIVAVTNRDLAFEVSQGKFRKDLFYRLNVVSLHNPPLRERVEDIELLCQHFLSKFARQFEMEKKHLSQQAISLMKAYQWPGNIRELENKLMQASLLTTSDQIEYEDLNIAIPAQVSSTTSVNQKNINGYNHQASSIQHVPDDAPLQPTNINNGQKHHVAVINGDNSNTLLNGNHGKRNTEQLPEAEVQYAMPHGQDDLAQGTLNPSQWHAEYSNAVSGLLNSMDMRSMLSISIGSVIELVLLKAAQKQCKSLAKTAVLLQLPISTTRRRLQKDLPNMISLQQDNNWKRIDSLLDMIVHADVIIHSPVDAIKELNAREILALHANNMSLASQLMGVSEPTMYKLRKQFH